MNFSLVRSPVPRLLVCIFRNYSACKHALWATMVTTGEAPPSHVDPRPLATRRRGGRPRGVGRALHVLANAQDPLIFVNLFDFEACLRVSAFRFTRGSALYRE
jgi:hypothetical protein